MKLIIAGATGFVATEVIRQSLKSTAITSVIALARRPVPTPDGSDGSKLKSVVVKDFINYSEEDKKQLAGADACIWQFRDGRVVIHHLSWRIERPITTGIPPRIPSFEDVLGQVTHCAESGRHSQRKLTSSRTLAITPSKSRSMEWDEVRQISYDYTIAGLKAIFEVRNQSSDNRPFRFLYMSGMLAERDQTKTPKLMPQYCLMRGETESAVLAFAKQHEGQIEACSVKPGAITKPGLSVTGISAAVLSAVGVLPSIVVTEVAAAMLDQVLSGFEKDPLENDDLVRIGRKALAASA